MTIETTADLKPCYLCGVPVPAVYPFRPELHRLCPASEAKECVDRAMEAREGHGAAVLKEARERCEAENAAAQDAAIAASVRQGIADALKASQEAAQPGQPGTEGSEQS